MEWLEIRVAFKYYFSIYLINCIYLFYKFISNSTPTRKEKDISGMWLSIGFG